MPEFVLRINDLPVSLLFFFVSYKASPGYLILISTM